MGIQDTSRNTLLPEGYQVVTPPAWTTFGKGEWVNYSRTASGSHDVLVGDTSFTFERSDQVLFGVNPTTLTMQGQIDHKFRHDIGGKESLFLAAVEANPKDAMASGRLLSEPFGQKLVGQAIRKMNAQKDYQSVVNSAAEWAHIAGRGSESGRNEGQTFLRAAAVEAPYALLVNAAAVTALSNGHDLLLAAAKNSVRISPDAARTFANDPNLPPDVANVLASGQSASASPAPVQPTVSASAPVVSTPAPVAPPTSTVEADSGTPRNNGAPTLLKQPANAIPSRHSSGGYRPPVHNLRVGHAQHAGHGHGHPTEQHHKQRHPVHQHGTHVGVRHVVKPPAPSHSGV